MEDFHCPITKHLMIEPSVNEAGETYELQAIEMWYSRGNYVDPKTGIKVKDTRLYPNILVKRLILKQMKNDMDKSINNPSILLAHHLLLKAVKRREVELDIESFGNFLSLSEILGDTKDDGEEVKNEERKAKFTKKDEWEQIEEEAFATYFGVDFHIMDQVNGKALIQKAAKAGSDCAMGKCYQEGWGVKLDTKLAIEFYHKSAGAGSSHGMCRLGKSFQTGYGVTKDYSTAVEIFRRAARRGNSNAIYNLGICYDEGYGVEKSTKIALSLYHEAAIRGNSHAETNLGFAYMHGNGVQLSQAKAARCYFRASQQENSVALSNLGLCYQHGKGVAKNIAKAIGLYKRSAELGHKGAMNNLGYCHENGIGVAQNMNEALKWYKEAAKLQSAKARKNIENLIKKFPDLKKVEVRKNSGVLA